MTSTSSGRLANTRSTTWLSSKSSSSCNKRPIRVRPRLFAAPLMVCVSRKTELAIFSSSGVFSHASSSPSNWLRLSVVSKTKYESISGSICSWGLRGSGAGFAAGVATPKLDRNSRATASASARRTPAAFPLCRAAFPGALCFVSCRSLVGSPPEAWAGA